jgi:hypothetical protein
MYNVCSAQILLRWSSRWPILGTLIFAQVSCRQTWFIVFILEISRGTSGLIRLISWMWSTVTCCACSFGQLRRSWGKYLSPFSTWLTLHSSVEEVLWLQRLLEEVLFVILEEFYNASVIRVSGMRLRKMKHPQAAFQGASRQRAWEGSTTTP